MNTEAVENVRCISVRQPWAWLIVNGFKNIENRYRRTNFRGRVLIHASQGMTKAEYDACYLFVAGFEPAVAMSFPCFECLQRGGIVGETTIIDCVQSHSSKWFTGPFGYVIANSKPLPFEPMKGKLGIFKYAK